jgi:WD40 repeat protein
MINSRFCMAAWGLAMGLLATLLAASSQTTFAADKPKLIPIQIATVTHDGPVDFEKEVLPILRRKCLACHNATEAESDLVLETPQTILKGGSEGPAVVAGKSAESLLLMLAARQKEPVMPPDGNDVKAKSLTPEELGLIKLWIDQGAKGEVLGTAAPVVWQPLPPGVNPIYAVAVSPDGQYAAAGRANQIFLYHIPSKREVGRLTDPELIKSGMYSKPGVAELDLVQSLAFSPDNQTLASGGYRTAKLWQRARNAHKTDLAGLESPARAIAVSADGKWAALAEENGKIKLFDLASGKVAQTLAGHSAAVSDVSFSADASKLVSGSQDKTFRVWNTADGKEIAKIETPAPVNAIAFVTEDKQVATGGADNLIRVWDLPDPAAEKSEEAPKPVKDITGHTGPITSLVAMTPAGVELLSGSQDGTARVWNVAGGTVVRQMSHGAPITSVAVRADGQRIASASANNTARLWNGTNGQQIAELKGDFRTKIEVDTMTRAVALAKREVDAAKKDLDEANKRKTAEVDNAKKSADAAKLADDDFKKKDEAAKKPVADKEAADKVLETAKADFAKVEEAQKAAVTESAAAAEALKKAQADLEAANKGEDQAAKDAAQKAVQEADAKNKAADEAKKKMDAALTAAQNAVKAAEAKVTPLAAPAQKALDEKNAAERAMNAAKRSVERADEAVKAATDAIPTFDAAVKQMEEKTKKTEASLETAKKAVTDSEKPVLTVAFSHDGLVLATAGDDQIVHTWDAETGAAIETFSGQGAAITAMAFTAAGDVVSAAQNKTAIVWDTNPEWKLQRVIGSPTSPDQLSDRVTALDFSPDGKMLATGSGEPSRSGELKIWNVDSGSLVREVKEAHSDTIFALDFSPDGQQIASCGADRFAKIFNVADGKFVRSFEGHTHHVLGVTWRADGRMLATSGADNVLKIWDPRTGDQQRTIQGFGKEVTSIHFVADGDIVVASSGDKTVQMKNATNGGNVRSFAGAVDFMYSVDASGDGKIVVAGGQDSVLRIWTDAAAVIATFEAPKQEDKTAAVDK